MENKIKELDEKIQNLKSEENIEELEVSHFELEKGKVYKEYKKIVEAVDSFKKVIEKCSSFNLKMDAVFEIMLLALQEKDLILFKEYLDNCKKYLTDGGDWEKRNRMKVYEGLYDVLIRDFKEAGKLLLDALMTFTSYELMEYKDFVFYTSMCNIITVDRNTLKNRIIDNSDVVACIKDIPHLEEFLNSFYNGQYSKFLELFLKLIPKLKEDFFMGKHYKYFVKELRIKAFSQYLRKLNNNNKNNNLII